MTDKMLQSLGIAAGLLVLVSIWVGLGDDTPEFEFVTGSYLFVDLDTTAIDKFEVTTKDGSVALSRQGPDFVIDGLGYPAAPKQVRELQSTALKITLDSEVTSDPQDHAALGVDGGDDSKTVKMLDADGNVVAGFIVGKDVESPDGAGGSSRYVRRVDDDTVYTTSEWINLRSKGLDYVEKSILSKQRDDIVACQVSVGGETYTISRGPSEKVEKANSEDGEAETKPGPIQLDNVPEGKRPAGKTYESVFSAASYLSLSDLKPASEAKDLEFDGKHVMTLKDHQRYTFEIAKKAAEGEDASDDEFWIKCKAEFVGPTTVSTREGTDEEAKKGEAVLLANKAVKEFNRRHGSWVYKISSWAGGNMVKPFDELVEDDIDRPDKISASHILIPFEGADNAPEDARSKDDAKAFADELLQQVLADPSKFEELAKENSSCSSADKGGDLGEFPFEQMVKPFSEAAFALEVGQTCDKVVETKFGYHVIKRTK